MRILALDLGDAWVGTAVSDPLGIICRPLETVRRQDIFSFFKKTIDALGVTTIVVSFPASTPEEEGEQAAKTKRFVEKAQKMFPVPAWVLFDEYGTSQEAVEHQRQVKRQHLSKESKHQSHSLAAAFLLQRYLEATRK